MSQNKDRRWRKARNFIRNEEEAFTVLENHLYSIKSLKGIRGYYNYGFYETFASEILEYLK